MSGLELFRSRVQLELLLPIWISYRPMPSFSGRVMTLAMGSTILSLAPSIVSSDAVVVDVVADELAVLVDD